MEYKNKNKITARQWYSDVDFNLTPHPSSGDIIVKQDKEAVKRSVRNIMLTNNFERPFRPNFGANLRGLLFEYADNMTRYELRQQVIEALNFYEPRVSVSSIELSDAGRNGLNVNVKYGVRGIKEQQNVEVLLERVR
tara:strand:- start:989 stop:1399 length:411 start_codon:yes stop_codon:yes gene_type:complete